MEQRGHLNRIPELAASVWTGSPSEIFYDMYYGDKRFEDSMADFSSMIMEDYGEEPVFQDDEFAVEKSLYQIEMAGGADSQSLSSYAGMLTPWGPGLEIPEIESVLNEYPAVEVGFNANNTDLMDDADTIFNHPAFTGAADRIEDEAEDKGLLGNIGAFFSGVGEKIGDAFNFSLENLGESLTIQSQGTQDLGSGFLDMAERYAQTVGEHLEHNALVEQSGIESRLFGGELEQTQDRLDAIEDRELKRADFQDWDQALNNDVTGLIAFFGDEQNYANGILDRATVMEWIEGLIASPTGSSDREIGLTLRETVNQAQKSAIKIDQTEETAQSFAATAQPTPTLATSIPGESGGIINRPLEAAARAEEKRLSEMPQAPIQEAWFGSDQGLGPEATMQDEGVRAVDLDLMQASGLMPEGRFTPTEEEALMEEGLEPGLDADWAYTGTDGLEEKVVDEATEEGSDYFDQDELSYKGRFLREFNRRPESGRYEYQSRIGNLFNESDMLYWLHEPWTSREWSEGMGLIPPATLLDPPDNELEAAYKGSQAQIERDHYSKWVTGFLNSPDDLRGENLYTAVEDLRDSMGKYEDTDFSGDALLNLRAENPNDSTRWSMFMNPADNETSNRLSLAVARYNAPPDADANFNNMQFRYYSNLLGNWEATGKSRESFLKAFVSQRPSYSPAQ